MKKNANKGFAVVKVGGEQKEERNAEFTLAGHNIFRVSVWALAPFQLSFLLSL